VESDNDLAQPYMAYAENRSADASIEDFRRRVQQRSTPSETTAAPAAQSGSAPLKITVTPSKSIWEHIGSAAGDIGYGVIVEGAPAVVGGVNDAVRNTITGARDLADWLTENRGGAVQVPSTGNATADKIIRRPLSALADVLPEKVKEQSTVTGHIIRDGSRFLTGFIPAARMLGGGIPGVVAAGGAADFATMDPNDAGISNLIESVPALRNPVTQYMATDPDDPQALKRLKHAVEGAGFGLAAEGIFRGIRLLANARRAVPEIEAQKQLYGDMSRSDILAGGEGPAVVTGKKLQDAINATELGVPGDVAAKGLAGSADDHAAKAGLSRVLRESDAPAGLTGEAAVTKGPDVFINFGRINTADDVKSVIRDMADAFKGDINKARRGVQSNEQTAKLADQLGMTSEDLLARRHGQPMNAEESLAARRLLNTSADKLLDAARKAADPNAGLADQFNFRRMMAVHHAIQSEVIAARTETARALQAWSIPAGTGKVEMARQVQLLMDAAGGAEVTAGLARRMASLGAQGVDPAAMAAVVRRGWTATSMDAVKESFVLGLLWSPKTHLANSISNLAVAFQQVYERSLASKVGDFLGSAADARVVDGEAIAMAYGMITSLKDAFRLSARALRTGETGSSLGKIDLPFDKAISSATVARERGMSIVEADQFAQTAMGRTIDFMGNATAVPGRLLGAEDEFFKTIAYRGELHAQSLRMATQEGRSGPDKFRRMAEIVNDPPENLRIAAADAALYSTFTNRPGEWAQALMAMRNSGSLNPTFLILPFVRTPANILRYSFEHSPLAPLVGQWREDIAAGGARRDLALSRMATGTATIAVATDMAASGLVTGPGPTDAGEREALMRTGWKPWSVYVDGKYYAYNRLDPVGMLMGMAATLSETIKAKDLSPGDYDTAQAIVASMIAGVSQSVVDKTYFRGVTEFLDMVHGAEKGEGGVSRYINRQTGSLMPFSSLANVAKSAVDPVTREVNSPMDALAARIPVWSESLPPARDLWGTVRKSDEVYGRVIDIVSPSTVSKTKESPIDAEITRLETGVKRIAKKSEFMGADVNFAEYPQVYDEYVRLSGNELKHPAWKLGAKDFLDAVVTGKHQLSQVYQMYSDGPEGGKASFIKNQIAEYRKLAQAEIMSKSGRKKFPEFTDYVDERRHERQEMKMPIKIPGGVPRVNLVQ